MARIGINTGSAANDNTGSTLRAAGGIINDNFSEIYTHFGDGTNLTSIGGTWTSTSVGIHTLKNVGIGTTNPRFLLEVGAVGASGTTLFVNGDARVTGILTIGTASITLNGATNIINVGTGITINGSTGIISATAIVLGGTTLTGSAVTSITAGSGISVNQSTGNVTITATGSGGSSQWVTTAAGIHTLSNVGIGTTNPTSALTVTGNGTFTGVVTATTFVGALTGTATTATNAQGLTGTPNITVGVATASTLNVGTSGTVITTTTAGLVGIGTTNPTEKLTVSGNAVITGITTHLDKISIRTSLISNEYASLSNFGKLVLGDGTSTSSGIDIVNNTSSPSAEIFTISTPSVNVYGKKIVVDYGGRLLLGGNLTSSLNNALTVLDNSGNITLSGYVSAAGTIGASGLTAGTVQISSGIVTATSGIVTFYGDASYTASGRWTLGADGNSNYTFTGIGFTQTTNDPVLYLARGRVYEFVNNSGGSHPFQIRVGNGGAAYNDGVTNNSAASGVIRFEVPFSAPNTLYYQCTSHSGMGNTISVYPTTI
jgi:hypothetical protein